MLHVVADLGNSRLKWGRLGPDGRLAESYALPVDDAEAWAAAWSRWSSDGGASSWTIASVNPPLARRLSDFLMGLGIRVTAWYRSAADVPLRHALEEPATTGADRAIAVAAAVEGHPPGRPGLVVSCGTAVTVERITADGLWCGGAIAPGLGLSARALHLMTAQLPLVAPREAPPAWGAATRPAMEAGLYWGTVGAIREILTHQAAGLGQVPWLVWTGGDAPLLAPAIEWREARHAPDLVLEGLARLAAGTPADP